MATEAPAARGRVLGVACTHCGLAVPAGLIRDGDGPQFCCAGCHAAYETLQAGGLGAYYRLAERREVRVHATGRSFEEFDHAAFEELYVQGAADGLSRTELYLEGVHCASCVWLIERVPLLLPGVARAELDVRRALARIEWDPRQQPLSRIALALDRLGYTPHPFRGVARDEMRRREDRGMLIRIGVAGAIAGNVMLASFALYSGQFHGMDARYVQLFRWVSLGLTVPAVLGPGWLFFRRAWAALRLRALHMDLPIAIALAAGTIRGVSNTLTRTGAVYFDGVTALIFLLLVGRFLQQRGERAATDAAELLYALAPGHARVVDPDGSVRDLPVSALLPGMMVEVRPGEVLPADGTVTEGVSTLNAALLTGESRPVEIGAGATVFAGTQNIEAPIRLRVEEAGESSRLANILRQVEESSRRRAPVVALADRLAGWFVAAVLVLAAITFALWHRVDPSRAWDQAIALLIVTCPCALALATPLAVTMAIGRAARAGIYIKGGDALERLSHPGTLVLDKTGTLTEGRTSLEHWTGDRGVRPLVLAVEAAATHPIAEGFRRAWPEVEAPSASVTHHRQGHGITGTVAGHTVIVGSPEFVAAQATGADRLMARRHDASLTAVLVAVDGAAVALAEFGDRIRPDTAPALAALRRRGWKTLILSGDANEVTAAVGAALGFAPGEVHGGADPEAKLGRIEAQLRRAPAGEPVVMVGDGVNDAAAIAAASVGIGVHGGAEACLATADIHLTAPGLTPLVAAIDGAARTMAVIRRNMAWALAYNLVGVGLAITGHISPLIAALLMPASSLTVVVGSWLGRTFDANPGQRPAGEPAMATDAARVAA